ncbi:MAG TPA: GDSL-type esterase/lipase family protein [Thermoleophilia bacterium]|nr:GDSL-type esterase/lipase family protein [Thermoleophilia bacterium]
MIALAALFAVAGPAVLAGCGSTGSQVAAQSPAATAAALPASPSTVPSPAASSSPPLDRPTKKHPLRIYFGGDSLAGMPAIMLQQLTAKNRLAKVHADYVESSRLTYDDPVDWPSRVKQQLSAGRTDVGVFMIGANDTGMPMIVMGDSVMYPKKKWLEEYERRARRLATIMLRGGVERVYWVGMPIMPSAGESRKMRAVNELFERVAASSPDVVYVDSYDLLAKKSGDFEPSLRSGDGVHYTNEGARVVAEAVWKAIRKDWGGR